MTNDTARDRVPRTLPLLLLVGLLAAGCSSDPLDDSSPTSTSARAQLTAEGAPVTICQENCIFEGGGANRGLGCAANVRGTTRVNDSAGKTLVRLDWKLEPTWIVRPGETFLFDGCCFDPSVMTQTVRYETEFAWDDVPCDQS